MQQSVFACNAGSGQILVVGAPSGTGKTRLIHECLHQAKQLHFQVYSVKFAEYEKNIPLSAFSLLLLDLLNRMKSVGEDASKTWLAAIKSRFSHRLPILVQRMSVLEALFSVEAVKGQQDDMQVFHETLAEFICHLALPQEKLLIFFDDLQWADWQSIQVLTVLQRRIREGLADQLIILGTLRSDEVEASSALARDFLAQLPDNCHLNLQPLTQEASGLLVEYLLDEQSHDIDRLKILCYQMTAGNPFYIYEFLKSSMISGLYQFEEEAKAWHFHAEKASHAQLSIGVVSLVRERMAQLAADHLLFLQVMASSGHSVSLQALHFVLISLREAKLSQEEFVLFEHELVEKSLINRHGQVLSFFHDKIEEAALTLIPEDKAETIHFLLAQWLAEQAKSWDEASRTQNYFDLARHILRAKAYERGDQWVQLLLEAASCATRIFAFDKVSEYLSLVIDREDINLSLRIRSLELFGDAQAISGNIPAGIASYQKALDLSQDRELIARCYSKISRYAITIFDYNLSYKAADSLAQLFGYKFPDSLTQIVWQLLLAGINQLRKKLFPRSRWTKNLSSPEHVQFLSNLNETLIPIYFTSPIKTICAIVYLTSLKIENCNPKLDQSFLHYWGSIVGSIGFNSLSKRLFSQCSLAFEKSKDSYALGVCSTHFAIFNELQEGDEQKSIRNVNKSIAILESIGEQYWKNINIMNLLLLSKFFKPIDKENQYSHYFDSMYQSKPYFQNMLSPSIRIAQEAERDQRALEFVEILKQAESINSQSKNGSIDSSYMCNAIAEYYLYINQPEAALPYARRAFHLHFYGLHRVFYSFVSSIYYAESLIRCRRYGKSLFPIAFAALNCLIGIKILIPHNYRVTSILLQSLHLKRLARWSNEKGLRFACARGWLTQEAELREQRFDLEKSRDLEYALYQLEQATKIYESFSWKRKTRELKEKAQLYQKPQATEQAPVARTKTSFTLRNEVESKSLILSLVKLSAATSEIDLLNNFLQTLCMATGSELSLYLECQQDRWQLKHLYNLPWTDFSRLPPLVDESWLRSIEDKLLFGPQINQNQKESSGIYHQGSSLVVPLFDGTKVLGLAYCMNRHTSDFYEQASLDIASPLSLQASIVLSNLRLKAQHELSLLEKLELQQAISEEYEASTLMAGKTAHYLNNPIQAVSGNLLKIDQEIIAIAGSIESSLPPLEQRSAGAQAFSEAFASKIQAATLEIVHAQQSLQRIHRIGDELRLLSGVHGIPKHILSLAELVEGIRQSMCENHQLRADLQPLAHDDWQILVNLSYFTRATASLAEYLHRLLGPTGSQHSKMLIAFDEELSQIQLSIELPSAFAGSIHQNESEFRFAGFLFRRLKLRLSVDNKGNTFTFRIQLEPSMVTRDLSTGQRTAA